MKTRPKTKVIMNPGYSLLSILLNALLLSSVALPQANIIVTGHVSDLKM